MFNGESILLALRQDPDVARLAGGYLKGEILPAAFVLFTRVLIRVIPCYRTVLTFGLPGYAGFEVMRRWLQAQGLMVIPTITLLIASPINIFLNWLLVWGP